MKNIETVVRERNKAFYLLETGETGERPVKDVIDAFGLPRKYRYVIGCFDENHLIKNPFCATQSVNNMIVTDTST